MKPRQSANRNRMFALPVILVIGALLLLAGALAPLLATQAATVDTPNAAPTLHQAVPTPTPEMFPIQPLPTEEPTPTPSPTADPNSVITVDPDNATVIPVNPEDDGNDVIQLDPDSDSVIGIDYEVAPTPTPGEPTPFPEEESDEPGVRVVVRWCPFGTELGGPRVNHPLIEKLCTLDGPDIKVDLTRADGRGETHSGGASKTFPANIDLTPVKPGRWLLEIHPSVQVDLSALYCSNGDELVEAPSLKPGLPAFEIDLGESEQLECSWYGENPEREPEVTPTRESGDGAELTVFKYLCPEGTQEYRSSSDYIHSGGCANRLTDVVFHFYTAEGDVITRGQNEYGSIRDLVGIVTIEEVIPAGYGEPAVFCGMYPEHSSQWQRVSSTDGRVDLTQFPNEGHIRCAWYNIPGQPESGEESDADKKAKSAGAVEVTTHQCKGTPPRGADYGWYNKNCAAASGTTLELATGEKDDPIQLPPVRTPIGSSVNKDVPAGTYLLTQTGGSPLNAHAVWCATLKPDQAPTPSDYAQVSITRAGVSIEVHEGAWTSCKVFGPATRGDFTESWRVSDTTPLHLQ